VLDQVELPHANGAPQQYLARVPADTRIAAEATGNWVRLTVANSQSCAEHPD